jgi:hypothetical protein
LPAPPCLKTADTDIRVALNDYIEGATLALNGLNDLDSNEINDGSDQISAGSTALTNAAKAINQKACGISS